MRYPPAAPSPVRNVPQKPSARKRRRLRFFSLSAIGLSLQGVFSRQGLRQAAVIKDFTAPADAFVEALSFTEQSASFCKRGAPSRSKHSQSTTPQNAAEQLTAVPNVPRGPAHKAPFLRVKMRTTFFIVSRTKIRSLESTATSKPPA